MASRACLEQPSARRREEFLGAVGRSRRLHGHFGTPPKDRESYGAWLTRGRSPTHDLNLVIEIGSDALVGVVNVNDIVRGSFHSGHLGYYAFTPHQGKGLMREGLSLLLTRAFGELGLHRLEANIQPDNPRSIALVQGLGFSREGFSRRYLKLGGRWRDHERWAMLREDWRRPR